MSGMNLPLERDLKPTAPPGRGCAEPECDTVLSIYNDSDRCWEHAGPRSASRSLLRVHDDP